MKAKNVEGNIKYEKTLIGYIKYIAKIIKKITNITLTNDGNTNFLIFLCLNARKKNRK